MKRIQTVALVLLVVIMSVGWLGCGDDGAGGTYACAYEERRTDGCDGTGWQDWEYECVEFNADDYYITPGEVCANLTESGLYCEAGCCIDYEHRSIDLHKGTC